MGDLRREVLPPPTPADLLPILQARAAEPPPPHREAACIPAPVLAADNLNPSVVDQPSWLKD